ncbi:WYL domain-containing protein [Syntrophothermus lipocalidus]|uniref:WYL domain-containing protein n=1 Tax=Syntrophothermus lipocalidus TaxID=86170 RepID=UPI00059E0B65|nr:WYL domain-containing protein [Syntrophothermus lipocalidus]
MLADPDKTGNIFSKLVEALKYSYRVKLQYFTAYSQELTERLVKPYGLICKRQNWYLVAHCLKRNDIQVFSYPATTEAVLLHLADMISSKVNGIDGAIKSARDNGAVGSFRLYDRNIYPWVSKEEEDWSSDTASAEIPEQIDW